MHGTTIKRDVKIVVIDLDSTTPSAQKSVGICTYETSSSVVSVSQERGGN